MSFGVGFGDIAKAIGLAKEVVTRYREAPKQVSDLAVEISARISVLETADAALRQRPDESDSQLLHPILEGYVTLLNRLRRMYEENSAVAAPETNGFRGKARLVGKRLTFDPNEIKSCREQIGHYNGMLDSVMTSLNLTMSTAVTTMIEDTERIKDRSKEDHDILAWLTPSGMDSRFGEMQTERLRKRVAETGDWFPELVEFTTWIEEPQSTLLCLGIPGAGKSILSSVAIHHLQELQAASKDSIGVGIVLFDFKSRDEPEDIVACLLSQFVRQTGTPPDLQDLFRRYKSKPKGSRPLIGELLGCLGSAVSSFERSFIVTDALDEYEVGSRAVFLETMFHLQQITNLNLFATLRPIDEITALFEGSGLALHRVDIDAKDDDVRLFLNRRIAQKMPFLRNVSTTVKKELISEISKASTGIFLLAELYLQAITKCRNVASIRKTVQNLPKGQNAYDSLYANTMQRISVKESRDLAMHVLSWAGWARRPITVRELQHALAIMEDELVLDDDNTTDAEAIVSVCEGLITIDAQTHIVRLIHYTTREYLEGVAHQAFPTVERDILDVCLRLISSPSFEAGHCETDKDYEVRLAEYPLYDYAAKNWGLHASTIASLDDAPSKTKEVLEEVLLFLRMAPQVDAAVECLVGSFAYLTDRKKTTGLYLAVWFGLTSMTEDLLSKGYCHVNDQNAYGHSALDLAVRKGFLDLVRVLLAHGAQVDAVDSMGRTPLAVATERGDMDLIKTLVSHGAHPLYSNRFGVAPIHHAAEDGNHDILRLFVGSEAHGRDLITHLGRRGDKKTITCLLATGVSVDLRDSTERTALLNSCQDSREDMTRFLLANGADHTLTSKSGSSALMFAADRGWAVGVEILLEHDPECAAYQDRDGDTALALTCVQGHKSVVEVFLKYDAGRKTINVANLQGRTPLIHAAASDSDVLEFILDEAMDVVDINSRDDMGITALHRAAYKGQLKHVTRLLELINVDEQDDRQHTPLWRAAFHGHDHVVAALLQAGANIDAPSASQKTPLWIAAYEGHKAVVATLLQAGADANIADEDGITPLRIAAEQKHIDTVEELIRWDRKLNGIGDGLDLPGSTTSSEVMDLPKAARMIEGDELFSLDILFRSEY